MSRRVQRAQTQRMSNAAAMVGGFIRPAGRGRRVAGRPLYATVGLVEELEAACWEDWEAVAERLALGAWAAAMQAHNDARAQRFRWHAQYLGDDGRQLPIAVTMPAALDERGSILVMLDGE